MKFDLQSLFVHSWTHWLRPRIPPPSPHLDSYTRALLVSQDLFVSLWSYVKESGQGPKYSSIYNLSQLLIMFLILIYSILLESYTVQYTVIQYTAGEFYIIY
jgi:hypothetical protein